MEVTIETGSEIYDLSIANSYAPHMGYSEPEVDEYWTQVNERMDNIPRTHIKLWMAENNGQIAQSNDYKNILENGHTGKYR